MFSWVHVIAYLVVIVVSYLLGSINFGIIVSKLYAGDDVRKHGSGSAGMTNTLRTYGVRPAVYTAIGDFSKGFIAVILAHYLIFPVFFGITPQNSPLPIDIGYIAGFFALIGHVYPVFFRFKGGKGVMTALGVISALTPVLLPILLLITLPIIYKTKMVSLGSIIGAILLPIFTFFERLVQGRDPWIDTLCALVIGVTILILHRSNIKRLLSGTENKFTPPKKEDLSARKSKEETENSHE